MVPVKPATPGVPLLRRALLAILMAAASSALAQGLAVSNHDRDQAQRAYVDGAKAITAQDLRAAVRAFAKASALDPGNRDYDAALAIARDNLATQLMQQALKARLTGDNTTWRARALEAASADSRNPMVVEHAADLLEDAAPQSAVLNPIKDDAASPIVLTPLPGTRSFHLLLPAVEVLRQVLSAYGITPVLDSSVGTARIHFDADDVTWDQAAQLLTLATGTFVVPLDPARVLIAADKKDNRSKYERLALETLYLPGLTSTELNDVANIARNVFEAQQASVRESSNTLTIRAPARRLSAFNFEVNELLEGRSEVLLDVDIYEVQRDRMVNEGAELPQTSNVFNVTSEVNSLISNNPSLVQQIIDHLGVLRRASPGNIGEIALALILSGQAGSTLLSQPFAYFGGGITTTGLTLSSAAANTALTSSDTRMLDKLQLRLLDQEEGTIKVGERYPIVTSSYSNLATGSTSIAGITSAGLSNTLQNLGINLSSLSSAASAAVPQVQYQDIGLTLNATARVEQSQDISLKLQFQLSSLSGQTLNSNPIINNRQIDSIINVKAGERTVLVSQVTQQETAALIGLPFLSEIPGFELGTNRMTDKMSDHIIIVVTPRVVRLSHTSAHGQMVLLPAHS